SHGGICLVHVLPARTAGAEGVDAQVGRVDLDVCELVGLGHDGHGAGRGVNAPLRLGGRHTLHPVGTGFELQAAIHAVAVDTGYDFAVTADFRIVGRHDFDPPALALGVPRVH